MTDITKRTIVFWDIDKLIPYPQNAKKHPQEQVDRLAASIAKLGITPIMVEPSFDGKPAGTIIAGHGRRLASLQLGRTRVPVDVRIDLTKLECDALRIADNAAVSAETDYDLVSAETMRLLDEGFDADALGMTANEIKALSTDIGGLDDSAFIEDISGAVELQKALNGDTEAAIDAKLDGIGKAFGFTKVTTEESRVIRGFMARITASSGLEGAQALVSHINAQ